MTKAKPHPYKIVEDCYCGYCCQERELLNSGLTKGEKKIMDHLADAWNSFEQLHIQHGEDIPEFRRSIRSLQHLLGMRIVRRTHPTFWRNEESDDSLPNEAKE
jgi:hypothetical protein